MERLLQPTPLALAVDVCVIWIRGVLAALCFCLVNESVPFSPATAHFKGQVHTKSMHIFHSKPDISKSNCISRITNAFMYYF